MIRRIPIFPTILVAAAVATMIALGFWQLDRGEQKAHLLARYKAAAQSDAPVPFPQSEEQSRDVLYRKSSLQCGSAGEISAMAGHNMAGESGWAVTARCGGPKGPLVVLGWSRAPVTPQWQGGAVTGVIASGPRLVADPPLAGLEANGKPDPSELPDNHFAYAMQWFLFAAAAVVIYLLAVRKRLSGV